VGYQQWCYEHHHRSVIPETAKPLSGTQRTTLVAGVLVSASLRVDVVRWVPDKSPG